LNKEKIIKLVTELLKEIEGDAYFNYFKSGEVREGIKETPERVSNMYEELFDGYNDTDNINLIKLFDYESEQVVVRRNIEFFSFCEHHMLPFYGKVDIAYLSSGKVIGISKLSRIVNHFAHRLNIQEKMTDNIAKFIFESELKPKTIVVIVEAMHLCEVMRGVKQRGGSMITSAIMGDARTNHILRTEILSLINRNHKNL